MGYKHCDCRDCFEITVGDSMCHDCDSFGCELDTECRSPHSYGSDDDCDATNGVDARLPGWQDRIGRR